jgi:hypothetical protein
MGFFVCARPVVPAAHAIAVTSAAAAAVALERASIRVARMKLIFLFVGRRMVGN